MPDLIKGLGAIQEGFIALIFVFHRLIYLGYEVGGLAQQSHDSVETKLFYFPDEQFLKEL